MDQPTLKECGATQSLHPLTVIHPVHEQADLLVPFVHALRLVHVSKGSLELIDIRKERNREEHLSIRQVFEKWKYLPLDSDRDDVGKLGISVTKVRRDGGREKEIAKRLQRKQHDILVLGFNKKGGFSRWFGKDIKEYLMEYFRQTTLYMPSGTSPFVDPETGNVTLRNIVVPVAYDPEPQVSIQALNCLLSYFPDLHPEVYGFHSGEVFPRLHGIGNGSYTWHEIVEPREKNIPAAILNKARHVKADLIIMATNGRDTLAQKLIGSMTELVLRDTPCPVLAVAEQ